MPLVTKEFLGLPNASSPLEVERRSWWRSLVIYLEMIKFSHTVFALPFALLSAAIGSHRIGGWRPADLIGVVCCMVFARTAAMGFNRWADRDVDALNPRTRIRALPRGLLTARQVEVVIAISSMGFFLSTSIFYWSHDNAWPMILSPAVLAFLFSYSYAKRFTWWAHAWLGMALALAPIAAWIGVAPGFSWTPILLGGAVLCWVTGFDIIYACQDLDFDRSAGLQSVPARWGYEGSLWIARVCHAALCVLLIVLWWVTPELGIFFAGAVAATSLLLIVEHVLARRRDLLSINIAFLYVNGAISLGLLAAGLIDLNW